MRCNAQIGAVNAHLYNHNVRRLRLGLAGVCCNEVLQFRLLKKLMLVGDVSFTQNLHLGLGMV